MTLRKVQEFFWIFSTFRNTAIYMSFVFIFSHQMPARSSIIIRNHLKLKNFQPKLNGQELFKSFNKNIYKNFLRFTKK